MEIISEEIEKALEAEDKAKKEAAKEELEQKKAEQASEDFEVPEEEPEEPEEAPEESGGEDFELPPMPESLTFNTADTEPLIEGIGNDANDNLPTPEELAETVDFTENK